MKYNRIYLAVAATALMAIPGIAWAAAQEDTTLTSPSSISAPVQETDLSSPPSLSGDREEPSTERAPSRPERRGPAHDGHNGPRGARDKAGRHCGRHSAGAQDGRREDPRRPHRGRDDAAPQQRPGDDVQRGGERSEREVPPRNDGEQPSSTMPSLNEA
ncbi:hypothetical protein [Stomatohabitans albus]|uniref:hypothetical protein n=1 Tax=Stomatohabitans albus TaxID=3110766 RepID=UPI00300D7DD1